MTEPKDAYAYGYKDGCQDKHSEFAPRLEAADALAEAMREMLGQGEGNPLYTSWGERVDDAAALATLAAYDAAKKDGAA